MLHPHVWPGCMFDGVGGFDDKVCMGSLRQNDQLYRPIASREMFASSDLLFSQQVIHLPMPLAYHAQSFDGNSRFLSV